MLSAGGIKLRAVAALLASPLLNCSAPEPVGQLDQQLAAIFKVLPGTYAGEAPIPVPPTGEMKSLFHTFAVIKAPQFGEAVVYYQLSRDSADGQVSQMKIFTFDTNPARKANAMHAHVFYPGQAPGNLDQEPARWGAIDPASLMTFPQECDLIWSALEGGFKAEVRAQDCGYTSETFKKTIRPSMSYTITQGRLIWDEALYTDDMQLLFGTNGPLPARRVE